MTDARELLRSGLWGIADQALVSSANFITLVVLARNVDARVFGEFALIYTGLLFASMVQFALITQPHNILGATRRGTPYVSYTNSATSSQLIFAGTLAVGALVAAGGARLAGADIAVLLLLAAPAAVAWQLQEYFRRLLYTEDRFGAVIGTDAISYGGQALVILALAGSGRLSGMTALETIAGTSALAAAVAGWQLRRSLRPLGPGRPFGENWRFGKWLLTVPAYWMSTQFYLYVGAVVLGLAVAGALKAAQVLMGPLNLMFAPFESAVPIRFARTYVAAGEASLDRLVFRTLLVTTPLVAAYCLAAAIFARPLLQLFYGSRYVGYDFVLRYLAIFYFFHFIGAVLSAGLRAKRQTKAVFLGYLYASLVGLACSVLIPVLHSPNAVGGIILAAVTLTLVLWRAYRQPGLRPAEPATAHTAL